ncbi:unnamed protein product [Ectocarpus sp. 6 AP-2014]
MIITILIRKITRVMSKILKETNAFSKAMAVTKKRRSKSKGKTRLSNWKHKSIKLAKQAKKKKKSKLGRDSSKEQTKDPEKEVVEIENKDSKTLDDKIDE